MLWVEAFHVYLEASATLPHSSKFENIATAGRGTLDRCPNPRIDTNSGRTVPQSLLPARYALSPVRFRDVLFDLPVFFSPDTSVARRIRAHTIECEATAKLAANGWIAEAFVS